MALLNSIEPSISKVSSLLPLASLIYLLYINQAQYLFTSHSSCTRIINFYLSTILKASIDQDSWLKLFFLPVITVIAHLQFYFDATVLGPLSSQQIKKLITSSRSLESTLLLFFLLLHSILTILTLT